MTIFVVGFWIVTILCTLIFLLTKNSFSSNHDKNFCRFQHIYLLVYLFATASDWIQGPYIYALYRHYGFSSQEIDRLFVAGYGSSMVFGTFVGSLADRFGRKKNCLLYAFLYSLSCITKHIPSFSVLFIGRIISGIATSILCSAFESWLICEHNKNNYPMNMLSPLFSRVVIGNSLVAIASGIVAQFSVDYFGYVAPYDIAIIMLMIMSILIFILWDENYGDEKINYFVSFQNAFRAIKIDAKICYLGLVQSLFEGSMYTFVLKWTPSLTIQHPQSDDLENSDSLVNLITNFVLNHSNVVFLNDTGSQVFNSDLGNLRTVGYSTNDAGTGDYKDGHRGQIPHGFIFAAFMVSIMTGSSLFRVLSSHFKVESFLRFVLLLSAFCLFVPILLPQNQLMVYVSFILFELCVGIFWPSMSMMRGRYLPETNRAAIMNIFRVPLNFFVVVTLLQNFPINIVFSCCVVFLTLAAFFQDRMYRCSNDSTKSANKLVMPT